MGEQVGEIYYTVDMLTRPLVEKSTELESRLKKLEGAVGPLDGATKRLDADMSKLASSIKKANGAADSAKSSLSALYKILSAYLGLQAVKKMAELTDEYGQMASRIRQVTADTAEYEMVQARLLKTANATYRPLSEAQEVFIRTADSLRDLNYTTSEALDITDSFSLLLVTNAASAERGANAINAYSKSIQTGKIQSEQWQTILAAMPTVVDGISAATGRSREEIKKLGVEGKLSLEALNEGLRRSRDENEQLAADMETSTKDALTALTNSFQVFLGKVNESSGATGVFTDAVGDLSEVLQDPETIRAAQELAAGVVTALNKIISAAREVVSVTRWMADEMAARMGGAAADDIVRLNDEAERLRKTLNGDWSIMELAQGPLVPGKRILDGLFNRDELKKRLAEVEQMIADWKPPAPAPAPAPSGSGGSGGETERPEYVEAQAKATDKKTSARKRLTEAEKEAAKAARDLEAAQQRDAEVLAQLKEAIYQTTLSTEELVQRKAELQLSGYATPEQIAEVRALALELSKVEEIEKRRKEFGEGSVEQKIRGDVTPLSGGAFDDQTARYEAEALAEEQRYQEQLERLQEALDLQMITKQDAWALEEQLYQEHSDRMAQIDQARQDMQLSQWAKGFGDMADDLKAFAQVFADENSAMFKMSKAAAIAQTIIQTYQSAQQAFTAMSSIPYVGPALGIAAAAAAVAGGMARVAQIRSQTLTGGRLYGGPVSAGNLYRVNENGAPEVFQARNGRQFMIPNTAGEVISNREAARTGGGADGRGDVTVNQTIQVVGQVDRRTSSQIARDTAQRQSIAQARFGG